MNTTEQSNRLNGRNASLAGLLLARAVERECGQAIAGSAPVPTRARLAFLLTALKVSRQLAERTQGGT